MCDHCDQIDDQIHDLRLTIGKAGLEPQVIKLLDDSIICLNEHKLSLCCTQTGEAAADLEARPDADDETHQSLEMLKLFLALSSRQRNHAMEMIRAIRNGTG